MSPPRSRRGGGGGNRNRQRAPSDSMEIDDFKVEITNDRRNSPRPPPRARADPYSRSGDADGVWKHDMYARNNGSGGARSGSGGDRGRRTGGDVGVYVVRFENLHWNVTKEDLTDLMRPLDNPVKDVQIKYDSSGRSVGKATVEFTTRHGAEMAVQNFDDRELDEMKMRVTIVASRPAPSPAPTSSSSIKSRLGPAPGDIMSRVGARITDRLGEKITGRVGARISDRVGARVGEGGGGGAGGGGGRKPRRGPVTQEALDMEMDDYMNGGSAETPAPVDLGVGLVNRRQVVSYDGLSDPVAAPLDG
ncbi:hypothetical protein BDK51DRAFT_28082 [Blyttiomyces helicus]|uniref:RRM domain-containing protein n=1 Tax=Blyttiomyces helicus TaxID=388810 RepID=A0A4P9W5W2_9FUNG|nr:hypothetical protein BDK51DRAFT_28082 [Blyttiomyces helicus]|eukprot:RKO86733.1 hypothetical protein BDK51DRAFT_28082 [Blyttiomyces helicus]